MDEDDPDEVPLAQAWDRFVDPQLLAKLQATPRPPRRRIIGVSSYVDPDRAAAAHRGAIESGSARRAQTKVERAVVADLLSKLRTGRLVARGLVEPVTLASVPADIPAHLWNVLRPSQNSARARNGKLVITDVWIKRASSQPDQADSAQDAPPGISGPNASAEIQPTSGPRKAGRPSERDLLLGRLREVAAAGQLAPSKGEQARRIEAWAKQHHPDRKIPMWETIQGHIAELYDELRLDK